MKNNEKQPKKYGILKDGKKKQVNLKPKTIKRKKN